MKVMTSHGGGRSGRIFPALLHCKGDLWGHPTPLMPPPVAPFAVASLPATQTAMMGS